jgi:hypothetical protein
MENFLPVQVGFRLQRSLILVPGFKRIVKKTVVKKIKFTVHDFERFRVDTDLFSFLFAAEEK